MIRHPHKKEDDAYDDDSQYCRHCGIDLWVVPPDSECPVLLRASLDRIQLTVNALLASIPQRRVKKTTAP